MEQWNEASLETRLVNGYSIPNFGYRLGWGCTDRGLGLGLICKTPTQPVPYTQILTLKMGWGWVRGGQSVG